MAKQITLKNNEGKVYTLEYTRQTVKMMERQGFVPEKVSEQPMTYLPTLFAGAFMAHHRNIKPEEIEKIYSRLPNKHDLIGRLVEMYNDPIMTLLDEPDEDAEGNMSWTAGW